MWPSPTSPATFPPWSLTPHTPDLFQHLECAIVLPATRHLCILFHLPGILVFPRSLPNDPAHALDFIWVSVSSELTVLYPPDCVNHPHLLVSQHNIPLFSSTDQGWKFAFISVIILLMPITTSRMPAPWGQRRSFFSLPWNPLHLDSPWNITWLQISAYWISIWKYTL